VVNIARQTEQTVLFLQRVIGGSKEEKAGNKGRALEEYQQAKKLLAGLSFTACEDYLDKRLAALGYNPAVFQDLFNKGVNALRADPPDFETARQAFLDAGKHNPADRSIELYQQFADDLALCHSNGMALYAPNTPLKGGPWGRRERSIAFCIDRYEWPDKPGIFPKSSVTWIEANELCKSVGKKLCNNRHWTDACKGGENFTTQYPYGNTPDINACNTNGKEAMASGAKTNCKNSIGVYDMSGNLAEWADADSNAEDAMVMGGSYETPASAGGTCHDYLQQRKKVSDGRIGFRCCLELSKLEE
jgi:hypothetical protein